MNNLHRELAPITAAAWAEIEQEARRTFERRIAGRRVVDVPEPKGPAFSAVGTGHLAELASPVDGVQARQRQVRPVIELRATFTVSRDAVDDVERGSTDSDWQPVKDAAELMASAENRTVFYGAESAGITGIVPSSSNTAVTLPQDVREYPAAVAQALNALRLAGVDGPYNLLLSPTLYTAVAETSDHGYPVRDHLARIVGDGDIIWAPGLDGGLVVTERGGDFELLLGQDLSIGYLSHDADTIDLYLQESLTFRVNTDEASVVISEASSSGRQRSSSRSRSR
ncbi:bacteriocin family protein [Calidifontibacter sp. DB0510]|uniref:Type 1 encapsulin shell protein n=1 Tax=Metallococcus carri TaxID=1656884 RepID=A0A967EG92_9MICO|nr:family 1 encapsulin nanocompartment shell protein [Metallococcus carri]NHN54783.1 bacteriocin family protein [Metallococcus carri]NOP37128.1 bacteriocin family protein [Calidifontibacter sp. DB2511S]